MKKLMLTMVAFVVFFAISNAQEVVDKDAKTTEETTEVKKVELIKISDKQQLKAVKIDPNLSTIKSDAPTKKAVAVPIESKKPAVVEEEETEE